MTPPPPGTAGSPPRDDTATMRTCPACGQAFPASGRRRWCSDSCKHAGWRRRHAPSDPRPPVPPAGRKGSMTVYECPACGQRALGDQRCDDCGTFMRAIGIGGTCPSYDEPIAITELAAASVG